MTSRTALISLVLIALPMSAASAATALYTAEASAEVRWSYIVPEFVGDYPISEDDREGPTIEERFTYPLQGYESGDTTLDGDGTSLLVTKGQALSAGSGAVSSWTGGFGAHFFPVLMINECDLIGQCDCNPYCDIGVAFDIVFDILLRADAAAMSSGAGSRSSAGAKAQIEILDRTPFRPQGVIATFVAQAASDSGGNNEDADEFATRMSYTMQWERFEPTVVEFRVSLDVEGEAAIAPVPVPASFPLLGAGLASIAAMAARQRRKARVSRSTIM